MPADPEPPRADLGIVFVHGIGDHQESDTLLSFGEPMSDWLADWLRPQNGDVHIVDARLRAVRTEAESPAYALAEITAADQSKTTCLMTEAWWGDSVRPPDSFKLLGWLLTRGPLLVFAHYCMRTKDDGAFVFRAIRPLILAGVVQVVTLLALVLWVIPVNALRQRIAGAVRVLTLTLGDSFVLLEQEFQRAAFVDRVRAAISWAAPRAHRLVVIAHSQGGAISHEALSTLENVPVQQWITVGSGLEKLAFLRAVRRERQAIHPSAWSPLAFALTLFFWWQGYAHPWLWVIAIAAFVAYAIAMGLVENALKGYRKSLAASLAKPACVDRWLDFYATRDLVSAGEHSFIPPGPGIKRRRIRNMRSLFADHTAYFSRVEQCLPLLWRTIAKVAHTSADSARLKLLARRHLRHSLAHAGAFWTLSAGLWLSLFLCRFREALTAAGDALKEGILNLGFEKTATLFEPLAWLAPPGFFWAILLVAVAHLLSWRLFSAVWQIRARARWRRICRGKAFPGFQRDRISPWLEFLVPSTPLFVVAGAAFGLWPRIELHQAGSAAASILVLCLVSLLLLSLNVAFWDQISPTRSRGARAWQVLSFYGLAGAIGLFAQRLWSQAFPEGRLDSAHYLLFAAAWISWSAACLRVRTPLRIAASLAPLPGLAFAIFYDPSWKTAAAFPFFSTVVAQLLLALAAPPNRPANP